MLHRGFKVKISALIPPMVNKAFVVLLSSLNNVSCKVPKLGCYRFVSCTFRFFIHQTSYTSSLIASLKTTKTNTTVTYVFLASFPLRHFHRIVVFSTTSQQEKKTEFESNPGDEYQPDWREES